MKKYLLGTFAILLAIGFSAFSPRSSSKTTAAQSPYYWYEVRDDKTIAPAFNAGDDMVTKSHVLAEVLSPCLDDEGDDLCFYGSLDNAIAPNTPVSTDNADRRINRVQDAR